ncbi:carbohydrate esterase family 16 protein [Zasmidium cellare ATCC 36951]|uniref:Carbohydrate esterase family 16 protein n=1 Tax=Zasmidium cellare ATCC 36951 TaxID=1080233 RepID=A0A6A6CGT1_ZASCE|nr:carbohydrate esterase family 16 protein [Zasmidium cellare ATCC 36951]KAF2164626.1 carbohydrate esterase family 16 protein [Zasmidium cellare ATCC 36951]
MYLKCVCLLVASIQANALGSRSPPLGWREFQDLVTFGDSYTDDSRLSYVFSHNGQYPPVGYPNPINLHASDGGRVWPRYVQQYTNVNVHNYAVAGAVCSNKITPKSLGNPNVLIPSVAEYQVPTFLAELNYRLPNGTKFTSIDLPNTLFALWIGTNDLGPDAFITDSQLPGKTLVDYTECVFDQIRRLYAHGARRFVLLNVAPLDLAPQYALPDKGGLSETQYWHNKPANLTAVSFAMQKQVVSVNAVFRYEAESVARELEGSKVTLLDVHSLLTDIYNHPSQYLNGTAPLNVTTYINQCSSNGTCTPRASPDSYMWWDEVHPSEQVERIVAREFVDAVRGWSRWASWHFSKDASAG